MLDTYSNIFKSNIKIFYKYFSRDKIKKNEDMFPSID